MSLRWPLILGVIVVLSLIMSLSCGEHGCELLQVSRDDLWQLRAPRVVSAFVVGSLLSLAGALMQLLLRNPLADPYTLGISGGAAVGALLTSFFLPIGIIAVGMQVGSMLGAISSILLLFLMARRRLFAPPTMVEAPGIGLILTGVMIASGFGAIISLLLALSPDTELRGALFWLMGDLDVDSVSGLVWLVLVLAGSWSLWRAPQLNLLVHGEATAHLLGVSVPRLRLQVLLLASIATAAAVSVAGAIGFIGLVVPHVCRLVLGNDQRRLLPASMLLGAAALVLADLVARTIVAPIQLPVGVVTALIGVPVFLFILSRRT
ncbi:MAG: iron ABC transporter permease [Burkholderiales bacterium]|nr:iron ABC transporter permease [Burkholderiales bacterium]